MFWREMYSVEEAGNHSNFMDYMILTGTEKKYAYILYKYASISYRVCLLTIF